MLDLLWKIFIWDTLGHKIVKFFGTEISAWMLSKKLLTSSTFVARMKTFTRLKINTAIYLQCKVYNVTSKTELSHHLLKEKVIYNGLASLQFWSASKSTDIVDQYRKNSLFLIASSSKAQNQFRNTSLIFVESITREVWLVHEKVVERQRPFKELAMGKLQKYVAFGTRRQTLDWPPQQFWRSRSNALRSHAFQTNVFERD